MIVGGRDDTLEGGSGGWGGDCGGRDDQATAKLRQAVGHQRARTMPAPRDGGEAY